jgi:hypothetical protein
MQRLELRGIVGCGDGGDIEPEARGGLENAEEAVEVGGFGEIAVGEALVSIANVAIGGGCGEDGDGDEAEGEMGLDLLEEFFGVEFGEIEIEEDEAGAGRVGVGALVVEEAEGLFAVNDDVDGDGRVEGAEGLLHEADVGGVVFDDENVSLVQDSGYISGGEGWSAFAVNLTAN